MTLHFVAKRLLREGFGDDDEPINVMFPDASNEDDNDDEGGGPGDSSVRLFVKEDAPIFAVWPDMYQASKLKPKDGLPPFPNLGDAKKRSRRGKTQGVSIVGPRRTVLVRDVAGVRGPVGGPGGGHVDRPGGGQVGPLNFPIWTRWLVYVQPSMRPIY